jgi:C4-dicarboxylate transporter DctM subunit
MASVAGLLGILIPPSIPMVVFAVAASVSIADMFLAGLGVGLLLLFAMLLVNFVWALPRTDLRDRDPKVEPAPGAELVRTTGMRSRVGKIGGAVPALVMPVIILGGIYSGIFTPTEAGAAACLYGFFVGLVVYRELKPSKVPRTLLDGMLSTAPILIIIAMGGAFARALTLSGLPFTIAEWITGIDPSTWLLLLVLNLLLLAVGCFIEENTAIIILTPLLMPIVTAYGIDPIQFGVVMVLNLGIGLATPPMAPNLFVAARACEIPFHHIVGNTFRFLLFAAVPVLIAVNVVPVLTLWHQ